MVCLILHHFWVHKMMCSSTCFLGHVYINSGTLHIFGFFQTDLSTSSNEKSGYPGCLACIIYIYIYMGITWRIIPASKWLNTMMVNKSPKYGLFPFEMASSWLINGGDPNYLLTGMILKVYYPVMWGSCHKPWWGSPFKNRYWVNCKRKN